MAADNSEIPSSPSQSLSHPISYPRHFYLAVDRLDFKMVPSSSSSLSKTNTFENPNFRLQFFPNYPRLSVNLQETLVDLLGVVGRRSGLPMIVCCSSRDELDAVCSTVSSLPYITLSSLYSDLAESDRAQLLETFRHATMKWNQSAVPTSDEGEAEEDVSKSPMIVVTDSCLPIVSGESPLLARVLINYELPAKKEVYMRRMAACLAPDGIVINMVVGGEVSTLKSLEEATNLVIAEMPIQVSEILWQ